jgi:hypothetical protein
VGLPELRMYEALAGRQLARALPALLADYADLHERVGAAWMWASVCDQAQFVLEHFRRGASASQTQAARKLLGVLQGYARG